MGVKRLDCTCIYQNSKVGGFAWTSTKPRCEKNRSSGFPITSHTNHAVLPQIMARGLKFRIKEVDGLYYPCSKYKGADQLRGLPRR